jgi:hypothetical protein
MSDKPKRNKWASRRYLFAVWAAVMASYLIVSPSIPGVESPAWAGSVITALILIVGAFIGGESYTKTRLSPGGGTVE